MVQDSQGELLERWALHYIFGFEVGQPVPRSEGIRDFVVTKAEDRHVRSIAAEGGVAAPETRKVDLYLARSAELWEIKWVKGRIDDQQLEDNRAMKNAKYVHTPDGTRWSVNRVNYLHIDIDGATVNSHAADFGIGVSTSVDEFMVASGYCANQR